MSRRGRLKESDDHRAVNGAMYGSPATSRDLNLRIPVSPFKHGKEDSDLVHHHHQQQQQHMSTGLLRYRSAPSSLLGEMCEDSLPQRSSGADTETLFTRLVSGDDKPSAAGGGGAVAAGERSPRYVPEDGGLSSSAASQMVYQEQQQPQQQLSAHGSVAPAVVEGPYRVTRSLAMDGEQEKGGVNGANLVRHSSSPAGLFSHLSVENGYAVMSGMSGLKGQMSFLSRQSSSSGLMTQISEIGGESIGGSGPEDVGMGNGMGTGRCFIPGFPVASWDDPSLLSDSLSGGLKRARDPSEAQIGDVRCHVPSLTHHFSLPKTSSEMAAIFQFQDAVPCKIRAKRGCATHPRSIAERVRRTKISERMRRLQELVPNMDKQTNTADMLDLAVEYIKDLEKQVKVLSESRANCTCSSKQNP